MSVLPTRALARQPLSRDYSRRQILQRAGALGLSTSAVGAALATDVAPASAASRAATQGDGLTFWLYRSRLDPFDDLRRERIRSWSEDSGVPVNIVDIATSDYNKKIPAAIESRTLPDVLELTDEWVELMEPLGLLADVTSLYNQINAESAWAPVVNDLTLGPDNEAHRIVLATTSTYLIARDDLLSKAGLAVPETYTELFEFATETQDPPDTFGIGVALSNTSDANNWIHSLHSYGVRFADEAGESAVLGDYKDAVVEWTNLLVDAYEEQRVFPPGVLTWDQTGDNDAYQSGRTIFTFNPLSIPAWLRENKPELLEKTGIHLLPAGPEMRAQPVGGVSMVVRSDTERFDEASDLIHSLYDLDYRREFFERAQWGPAREAEFEFSAFDDFMPVRVDVAKVGTPLDWPDVSNQAFAEVKSTFVVPRMIQRVVSDGMSPEQSFEEAVEAVREIYETDGT